MTRRKRVFAKLVWTILALLVAIFYPILISIYLFLPLFTGVAGYAIIRGAEKGEWLGVIFGLLYLINLDLNLSLPFFAMALTLLAVYFFLYPLWRHFRCKVCAVLLSVLSIDGIYFGMLKLYDFVFATTTVKTDTILLYHLVTDLLVAAVLL